MAGIHEIYYEVYATAGNHTFRYITQKLRKRNDVIIFLALKFGEIHVDACTFAVNGDEVIEVSHVSGVRFHCVNEEHAEQASKQKIVRENSNSNPNVFNAANFAHGIRTKNNYILCSQGEQPICEFKMKRNDMKQFIEYVEGILVEN